MDTKGPLLVIVGPTASGKSDLAVRLAQKFGGEIVAADSRTIYKGLDIGTAKPNNIQRQLVRHHLIDIVNPNQRFTVADFQGRAQNIINDIVSRGRLPILVGGTGLYVDSVVYNFSFRKVAEPSVRARFNAMTVDELRNLIGERGFALPENDSNRRHLIRVLETDGQVSGRSPLRPSTLILGIDVDKVQLQARIAKRIDRMVADGLVSEVKGLIALYGQDCLALQAPAYRAFLPYISGDISLREAKQLFARFDIQYAKRQKTWFKRNQDINWICSLTQSVDIVTSFLSKQS